MKRVFEFFCGLCAIVTSPVWIALLVALLVVWALASFVHTTGVNTIQIVQDLFTDRKKERHGWF